jgi:hypothetical protein
LLNIAAAGGVNIRHVCCRYAAQSKAKKEELLAKKAHLRRLLSEKRTREERL